MPTSRDRKVDVVVVGGGPAGCAAALWCARRGLRVDLIERERFPRHRPGETLPPAAEVLFGQLGVADAVARAGFVRHPGTWVEWAGPRRFDAFGADGDGPWLGFQAPRDRLDRILLDATAEAGVTIHQPARAVDVLREDERVTGVSTAEHRVWASWVVDAGGGQHWLARRLAIPLRSVSPRLTARYGYARGRCPDRDGAPEIVADATGWTWTARIAPDLHHWTRLSFAKAGSPRERPPSPFDHLTPLGRPRGADVTWRIMERPAGPSYVCVGDAAAVLDPASSHGVLKALMSGMMAGHLIATTTDGTASTRVASQAYTAWLRDHFQADVAALTALYRSLPDPTEWLRTGDEPAGSRL